MSASTIIFYIVSALVLVFGAMSVFTRKIFRAAIYLLFSLIGIAGIYILMNMDFIAALQVLIYVGGIIVLIIFSIFLTHQAGDKLPKPLFKRIVAGASMAIFGLIVVLGVFYRTAFNVTTAKGVDHSARNIGRQMLDYHHHGYVYPFEIVSFLLLAALVGCIVIAVNIQKK
jgi:NADH-quinone oxidoreductase subunit J